MNKINDFYMLDLWLKENQRSVTWLADKVGVSRQAVYIWKDKGQIPESRKYAICYALQEDYGYLFEQHWNIHHNSYDTINGVGV